MRSVTVKASGTMVLPEILLEEILILEDKDKGHGILENARERSLERNGGALDSVRVYFDISGNRVRVISEITGEEFHSVMEGSFRIITETILGVLENLEIKRSEFARILSITDIHVTDLAFRE